MGRHMSQGSYLNISHQSEFLNGTHASQCDHQVRFRPNYDSTPLVPLCFNIVGLMACDVRSILADALNPSPV